MQPAYDLGLVIADVISAHCPGYSDDWIDDRLQQAVADAQWDEELGGRGVKEQSKAPVRAAVHEEAFGITLKKHRLV